MAESKYTIDGSLLTDIASAIRAKTGSSSAFTPAQMASEIMNIPSGGEGGGWLGNADWDNLALISADADPLGYDLTKEIYPCGYKFETFNYSTPIDSLNFPNCIVAGDGALRFAPSLIHNPGLSMPKVTYIGTYQFQSNTQIGSLYLPECLFVNVGAFQSTKITEVNLPKCQYIGASAFESTGVQKVSLPECLVIGSVAFSGNRSTLSSVYLPKVKEINDSAFQYASKLTFLSLPECVHIGRYAFYSCSSVTELYAPKCQQIMPGGMDGCNALISISLPECKILRGGAFRGCRQLSEIILPKLTYLGGNAFWYCYSLSRAYLGSCSIIGATAFYSTILSTLVIGYSSVCQLAASSVFDECPIGRGEGSVFVPGSLYSDYINDPSWSPFSSIIYSIPDDA